MPRSKRYGRVGGLPRTIRRSCPEAQAIFTEARENAVRAYGETDRADQAAFAALKQAFEKRGDHWIAKHGPAD
jgi:cation transport regulator ChaB